MLAAQLTWPAFSVRTSSKCSTTVTSGWQKSCDGSRSQNEPPMLFAVARDLTFRLALICSSRIRIILPLHIPGFCDEAIQVIHHFKLIFASLTVAATVGCSLPRPWFAPPGPVRHQQNNASFHDPYADADLGPEVVGARPRDFQKPNAEPVRSRVYTDGYSGR